MANLVTTEPIAVVTGASSGIGAATARRLATAGFHVVVAARRTDRIAELAKEIQGTAITLDITDQSSVDSLVAELPSCQVLINNAGGAIGLDPIEKANPADWQRMYEINVIGTLRVTQGLLPALESSGQGHVVIVGSIAGHSTYPGGGGYVAAKHAEAVFRDTLRQELLGRPIRVTEIAPGMVKTEEFSLVRFAGDQARADAVYEGVDEPLTAEDIADCIEWTVTRPARVNIEFLRVQPLAQAGIATIHRQPIKRS